MVLPSRTNSPFVLLDDAHAPGVAASRLYSDFVRQDVVPAGTEPAALDALLADGWRDGLHVTLFAPYESTCESTRMSLCCYYSH